MFRVMMATGLLAFAAGAARADDDVIRLKLPEPDPTALTLGLTSHEEAETIATRHGFRGGFYGGGFRSYRGFRGGFYGGGFRSFYRPAWGGWGGYRSFYRPGWGGYRSFYRPYWGGYRSFYRPYYSSFGLGYGGFGLGYGVAYGTLGLGYSSFGGYGYPCSTTISVIAPTTSLAVRPVAPIAPVAPSTTVPEMPRADGTFDYNGGPKAPVPMPPAAEEQARELPRIPTPVVDRVVSLRIEPKTGKWVYPAYGEAPRRTGR